MKEGYCRWCGKAGWLVETKYAPVLVDKAPAVRAQSLFLVKPVGGIGPTGQYAEHRCDEVRFPKKDLTEVMNRARATVGLPPVDEEPPGG